MKINKLLGTLMFLSFIFIIGTAGAFENDAISTYQAMTRITIATLIFFTSNEVLQNKKAIRSSNYIRQKENKISR